jgi:predicted CXXCH cytochrome family protein
MTILLFFFSTFANAGSIIGSPHDFRGYLWNESGEICKPCHAPHLTRVLPAPLWSQELSTDTYTMYAYNPSHFNDDKMRFQPNGSSKTCLSCHDGILAHENFGNITEGNICLHQDEVTGATIGDNHPISFLYDSSLAATDVDIYDPSIKLSGVAGSKGTIKNDMLFQGRMECSSCHDVHNKRAVAGTKLLLKEKSGSILCLTCHDK